MDAFVVLANGLDIGVSSVFSSHLLYPSFLRANAWSKCLVTETSRRIVSWWLCHLVPLYMWLSQKWDGTCKLSSSCNFFNILVAVGNVSIKDKWGRVNRSLECRLSRPHCWDVFRSILYAHCLNSFLCYRLWRSVLSKELRICHGRIIECYMVVHRRIKVLSIGYMSQAVIFWAFDIEIWDPP